MDGGLRRHFGIAQNPSPQANMKGQSVSAFGYNRRLNRAAAAVAILSFFLFVAAPAQAQQSTDRSARTVDSSSPRGNRLPQRTDGRSIRTQSVGRTDGRSIRTQSTGRTEGRRIRTQLPLGRNNGRTIRSGSNSSMSSPFLAPGQTALGVGIEVIDPLADLKTGPIGHPPLAIYLAPTKLTLAPTAEPGVYQGTVPVIVRASAQWPKWRISCVAESLDGPRHSNFSRSDIFMSGGLGPVSGNHYKSVSLLSEASSKTGGQSGGSGPVSLNSPQVVAVGKKTGSTINQVATLGFLVRLDENEPFGEYEFDVQFYGEGPGSSGAFPGPKLRVAFETEPSTQITVVPYLMEFGEVDRGVYRSQNNPKVTVTTNQDVELAISLQDLRGGDDDQIIDEDHLALGIGSTVNAARQNALGTAFGVVERRVDAAAGCTTVFYLTGKANIDGEIAPGNYQGVINIQIVGAC